MSEKANGSASVLDGRMAIALRPGWAPCCPITSVSGPGVEIIIRHYFINGFVYTHYILFINTNTSQLGFIWSDPFSLLPESSNVQSVTQFTIPSFSQA